MGCQYFNSKKLTQLTKNEKAFKKQLKEFNENIDKLFQKAEYSTLGLLNEINHKIEYELERL